MITEQAHAKINLSLDITGKREDGYHLVKMIMQTVSIFDELSFEKGIDGTGLVFTTDNEVLNKEQTEGSDNLVCKAVKALEARTGRKFDVKISLSKNIPIAAGMAGGSADAAATLRGINRLYDLGLTNEELRKISVKLGADVPFCVEGGLCLCEGIGEVLTSLPSLPRLPVLICKPPIAVSTRDVYKQYDAMEKTDHPDVDGMIKAIEGYDYKTVSALCGNVLEPVTVSNHEIINRIKNDMKQAGAINAMMSGSGPTVFGLFESDEGLRKAYDEMKKQYTDCTVMMTRFYTKPRDRFE